ncbi:N-6 DNA methylase [Photobacterium kishitanii]|uniref:N-6 DNA methylase n=1 Tax=Photobacterium kishitanii TaxID=318456 RepID=UPI002738B3E6|nr:N-6 DNA methylase [Photobacterium kishitanii]
MNQLVSHNLSLVELFDSIFDAHRLKEMVDLDSIDSVLRACLSLNDMKEAGSFFTGQALATVAVSSFQKPITKNSVILDPTCGAGNLLIECSRKLGIRETLSETLTEWGGVLRGYDIYPSFVEAAKLRIILEALSRGAKKDCSLDLALSFLSDIRIADAMSIDNLALNDVTHIIMNPPFTLWESPKNNYWNTGKVNAAGVVFDFYLRNLPVGCDVVAILPDVLRSGSRYCNWRNFINTRLNAKCQIYGQFSLKADVDVFLLSGIISDVNTVNIKWFPDTITDGKILSDEYDVCIGPLVAYRDLEVGESYPYIHSKNAPAWGIIKTFLEYRKFSGRVIQGPFVVIRRTSSPSDKHRVIATVISSREMIAVENHMIVIKPKKVTIKNCNKLVKILKSQKINDFLNERIR